MTYDVIREQEQFRLFEGELNRFLNHYDPAAPTLILLPGGMASSLVQAIEPFNAQPNPPYTYEMDWFTFNIMTGAANNLAMTGDQDSNNRMTVPNGIVGLLGIEPYVGFILWCQLRLQPLNYLIVPWDWRRRIEASADFFTNTVLPAVQGRLLSNHSVDLLTTNYSVISHSFGGLLLKMLLDRGGPFIDKMHAAISVAAPFYGYGGSQHFYFAGFPYLTAFYTKKQLAEDIGSMLGPYVLMFLDEATYNAAQPQLSADPDYPLTAYPSVDAANAALRVDPYNAGANRYPDGGWVLPAAITSAAATRVGLAAALPPSVRAKFFNIRGVQTEFGKAIDDTIVGQTWQQIASGFDPDTGTDPIVSRLGPGDDTIPAWSARLVDTPVANVVTITDNVEHVTLMDNPAVLSAIEDLIGADHGALAIAAAETRFDLMWRMTATVGQTQEIFAQAARIDDPGERRAFFARLPPEFAKPVIRRLFKDLMKAPPEVRPAR
jgi:hypothetical protein